MTDPLQVVYDALETHGCNPTGETWKFKARCPAHEDRTPSLYVDEGADGRVLLRCFVGCTARQIVDALNLRMADLFPDGHRKAPRRPPAITRAPAPVEALLRALTRAGLAWSGVVNSPCPYCDDPSVWWRVSPAGIDVECPQGCLRSEAVGALESAVWRAENEHVQVAA